MASIRFGAGIVDARGSISGQTFSRNASGAYIRARVAPSQPRTPLQTANRSLFGGISAAYSSLSEAAAQAWVDAAKGTLGRYVNRLGEQSQYTGQQLFASVQGIRAAFGLEPLEEIPNVVTIGAASVSDFLVTYDAVEDEFTATGTGVITGVLPAVTDVMIDVAVRSTTGALATSTPSYRRAGVETGVTSATLVDRLMEAVDAYIPTPERSAGGTLFIRLTSANAAAGQARAPVFLRSEIVAPE